MSCFSDMTTLEFFSSVKAYSGKFFPYPTPSPLRVWVRSLFKSILFKGWNNCLINVIFKHIHLLFKPPEITYFTKVLCNFQINKCLKLDYLTVILHMSLKNLIFLTQHEFSYSRNHEGFQNIIHQLKNFTCLVCIFPSTCFASQVQNLSSTNKEMTTNFSPKASDWCR